jgi:hypothetical protein
MLQSYKSLCYDFKFWIFMIKKDWKWVMWFSFSLWEDIVSWNKWTKFGLKLETKIDWGWVLRRIKGGSVPQPMPSVGINYPSLVSNWDNERGVAFGSGHSYMGIDWHREGAVVVRQWPSDTTTCRQHQSSRRGRQRSVPWLHNIVKYMRAQ